MSETLTQDHYSHAEIGRLNRESAARRVKLREYKQQLQAEREKYAALEAQLEQITQERDEFAEAFQAADEQLNIQPDELRAEVERLQGELRTRDHRAVFEKVAAEARVRPDAIDDLYRISGYTPDSDTPDPNHIKSIIEDQVSRRAYLLAQEQTAAVPPQVRGKPVASRGEPPSLGRGVPSDEHVSNGLKITKEQLRNPEWVRRNQQRILEMSRAGEFAIED